MLLGVGLPLIFIPIITASYQGIPPEKTDQASALMNMARNTGGSIGVSLATNVLAHREQFHQSRLVEQVVPSNVQYQQTLQQVTQYFVDHGNSLAQAQQYAFAWIAQQVQTQATLSRLHRRLLDAHAALCRHGAARTDFAPIYARSNCSRRCTEGRPRATRPASSASIASSAGRYVQKCARGQGPRRGATRFGTSGPPPRRLANATTNAAIRVKSLMLNSAI